MIDLALLANAGFPFWILISLAVGSVVLVTAGMLIRRSGK
jgi:hypothetical protein